MRTIRVWGTRSARSWRGGCVSAARGLWLPGHFSVRVRPGSTVPLPLVWGGVCWTELTTPGSEAMEAAIKMCRQYWVEAGQPEREHIIARFPSYHGNTLGALAVSWVATRPPNRPPGAFPSPLPTMRPSERRLTVQVGNVPSRRDLYKPLFANSNIHHTPSPTYYRSHRPSETEEAYSLRLASDLESLILSIGPSKIMAFVAEPVVGAALGVMPPPRGYFPAIAAVLRKYNILLVLDEVMSWIRPVRGVVRAPGGMRGRPAGHTRDGQGPGGGVRHDLGDLRECEGRRDGQVRRPVEE